MADILIKGMDMPKSCGDCPFLYDHDACYVSGMWNDMRFMLLCFNGHTDEYKRGEFPFKEKRVDWCPLVGVPTHGRLIDADELKELFRETITGIATRTDMKGAYEHMIRASAMVIDMIDDAPTVIEASEDGEQDGKL